MSVFLRIRVSACPCVCIYGAYKSWGNRKSAPPLADPTAHVAIAASLSRSAFDVLLDKLCQLVRRSQLASSERSSASLECNAPTARSKHASKSSSRDKERRSVVANTLSSTTRLAR
mmetsp:Transcript_52098/g.86364  ORF Transcript_52098/g.86364 Transcript_52098/m.86364 type:complete len:116 (+) Transcript_52098:480-827(+)